MPVEANLDTPGGPIESQWDLRRYPGQPRQICFSCLWCSKKDSIRIKGNWVSICGLDSGEHVTMICVHQRGNQKMYNTWQWSYSTACKHSRPHLRTLENNPRDIPHKHGKHSTGLSTYEPWVRTYSELFSCKSVLTVCSNRAQPNEIHTWGRAPRGPYSESSQVRRAAPTNSRIRPTSGDLR